MTTPRPFDWTLLVDRTLVFLIGLGVMAGCAVVLVYAYQTAKSPVITLHKREWACTQVQSIPVTTYVRTGSTMIPLTSQHSECWQWSKQP